MLTVLVLVCIEIIIPCGKRSATDVGVLGSDPEPQRAAAPAAQRDLSLIII